MQPKGDHIRRVGILFSGGPAPAANAVIGAAAVSFLEDGREVLGFYHSYSNLMEYHPVTNRLQRDKHFRVFTDEDVRALRNTRGVVIGTARANPGKDISKLADLDDPARTEQLRNVYTALIDLGVDALISIGGDGTLRAANLLYAWQQRLPPSAPRVRVVHLPKTIDNDYDGIDFTFGFFTAVDVMAKEVQNLVADAQCTSSYFIAETMGRKTAWLSYGVAIAGEACLVLGVEDLADLAGADGVVTLSALADRVVDTIRTREARGQHYGVVVVAEGLAERLPPADLAHVARDEKGQIRFGKVELGRLLADAVADRYAALTGAKKKVTGVQLGYEARSAPPHAFDVMLGSQLGIGAYRALVEEGLDGHMVSTTGKLDLTYVPFHELIDAETLVTQVRYIQPGSDFHRLARFLEMRSGGHDAGWGPGPRREG